MGSQVQHRFNTEAYTSYRSEAEIYNKSGTSHSGCVRCHIYEAESMLQCVLCHAANHIVEKAGVVAIVTETTT